MTISAGGDPAGQRAWWRWRPWIVLAMAIVPAVWHVVDFEDDVDSEFPLVARPTFSRRPPAAYRLAEPGDTIDRVALYASSAAVVLALAGRHSRPRGRGADFWLASLGLALAAFWHASTPGPTFDGWHGLGWRAIGDPAAPWPLRIGLAMAGLILSFWVVGQLPASRRRWAELIARGRENGILGLTLVAAILIGLRQVDLPGVEPVGYWPRWTFVWGMLAFDLALIGALPPLPSRASRIRLVLGAGGCAMFVAGGLALTWLHRPLDRFKAIVPGKIYISGMPTYRGLQVAHARHRFRTIVNLFPEDLPGERSPRRGDELRFAREHGIRYYGSPLEVSQSEAFLELNLAVARDPAAWPVLVHCHACMDRTPAWTGIYRFVVQGWPLAEVMKEMERHRGYRPKASVTLLYNRVLRALAPERYARDETAALLRRCAVGTVDPHDEQVRAEAAAANIRDAERVSRRDGATRRP